MATVFDMELTAQTLHEVTFGAKVRGYDPAEVDDFIAAVADGVEELQERLRRATERAARAEQQSGDGGNFVAPATQASSSAGEISKVWERAAAAAESAVQEAKDEAERILTEARQRVDTQLSEAQDQSESQLTTARTQAETQLREAQAQAEATLSTAHAEAEAAVSTARDEAARIASEAQGQLRSEIEQLETARGALQGDVNSLSEYLDGELSRVRSALSGALSTLDSHSIGAGSVPQISDVSIPPTSSYSGPAVEEVPGPDDYVATSFDEVPADPWTENGNASTNGASIQDVDAGDPWSSASANADDLDTPWDDESSSGSVVEEAWTPPAPVAPPVPPVDDDEDADPFLAELRRAVHDDGPLGPRDDDPDPAEQDDSISRLYASDEDDDKSGFFRRKK